jgi:multidrug transporter EmrE-like cation transporter
MSKYLLALFSILLTALGQLLLKKGSAVLTQAESATTVAKLYKIALNPYIWSGIIVYGLSTLVWIFVLSKMKLSVAYPMASISYVAVAVGSYYMFGETLGLQQKIALAIIILGVVLLVK